LPNPVRHVAISWCYDKTQIRAGLRCFVKKSGCYQQISLAVATSSVLTFCFLHILSLL